MTRQRSGRFGFRLLARVREFFFPFSLSSKPTLGPTKPTLQCIPGIERPGREADHLPSSAEVKNGWNYTSTHPVLLHGGLQSDLYFLLVIVLFGGKNYFPVPRPY